MHDQSTYEPHPDAAEIVRTTPIVLLAGITAAGKDTIMQKLLELGFYHEIITHTTRSMRSNHGIMEVEGDNYHFIDKATMQAMIADQQLIEFNQFSDNYYGTSVDEFRQAKLSGKIALGDIDVNGIASFRAIAHDNVIAIFVVPPDYATWRQRLEKRYASSEELQRELPKRAATAIDELEHALSVSYYHFIINDNLDRAVRVVDEIAHRGDAFNRHDDEARLKARDLLATIRASI